MSVASPKAWFPRKRMGFGLGWALHRSWQGWVLMVVTLVLAVGGVSFFESTEWYSVYVAVLLLAMVGVCWWKGERSILRGERE